MPDGQRSQGRAAAGRPRRGRTGWRHVVWPLAAGLAFCALGLWAGLAYTNAQASFLAQAVPAKAVIGQIYAGSPHASRQRSSNFQPIRNRSL